MSRELRSSAWRVCLLVLGSVAISMTPVRADQIELEPSSVIGGTGSWAGAQVWNEGQFSAEWVADNQFEDEIFEDEQNPGDDSGGFWLGKEGDEEESFVLDLEQAYVIDDILLYNTHNATFDDRATFGYEIYGANAVAPYDEGDVGEGGDNLVEGVLISEGELDLSYFDEGEILPQAATITSDQPFRYIRFDSVGPFHVDDVVLAQRSVGINEIKVFGTLPGGAGECDYNNDGMLDGADLELLRAEVKAGTNNAAFDVNGDGAVDVADMKVYVESADKLNTYVGDANLDGEFNSSDLVNLFTVGEYEDGVPMNSTWATGDFNGDGDFGSGDLVAAFQGAGYEAGPRPASGVVPEPVSIVWVLMSLGFFCALGRRRQVS